MCGKGGLAAGAAASAGRSTRREASFLAFGAEEPAVLVLLEDPVACHGGPEPADDRLGRLTFAQRNERQTHILPRPANGGLEHPDDSTRRPRRATGCGAVANPRADSSLTLTDECGYRHSSRRSRLLIPPTPEHLLPIYTYKCEANGHEFELRQDFSASPEQVCPTCGSTARRQLHVPTVIYKGSGFYTTDYARKSSDSSKAKASSSDGAASDGKSSGKSESSSKKDGSSSSSKKDGSSTASSKSTADS